MTSGKGVDDLINTLIKKKFLKKGLFNYGQDIFMAFSPPIVGCLVNKGLQKGAHRHPRTPLAVAMHLYSSHYCKMNMSLTGTYYFLGLGFGFRV